MNERQARQTIMHMAKHFAAETAGESREELALSSVRSCAALFMVGPELMYRLFQTAEGADLEVMLEPARGAISRYERALEEDD